MATLKKLTAFRDNTQPPGSYIYAGPVNETINQDSAGPAETSSTAELPGFCGV